MNRPLALQPELRVLMLYDHLPEGCIAFQCVDTRSLPHVRPGEWVVVDKNDRRPRHGDLYVIRFGSRPDQSHICMVRRRRKVGWVDQSLGPDGWTVGAIRNDECRRLMDRIDDRSGLSGDDRVKLLFTANSATGAWVEGPYADSGASYDHLCDCLVGGVIGLYAPQFEGPTRTAGGRP